MSIHPQLQAISSMALHSYDVCESLYLNCEIHNPWDPWVGPIWRHSENVYTTFLQGVITLRWREVWQYILNMYFVGHLSQLHLEVNCLLTILKNMRSIVQNSL